MSPSSEGMVCKGAGKEWEWLNLISTADLIELVLPIQGRAKSYSYR
jgi:hypothetical protein